MLKGVVVALKLPTDVPDTEQAHPSWHRGLIANIASITAIVTLIWYAILANAYEQFYSPLQVTLGEVGLTYANVLSNSFGAALWVILNSVAIALLCTTGLFVLRRFISSLKKVSPRQALLGLFTAALVFFTFNVTIHLGRDAANRSRMIEGGYSIPPLAYRTYLPLSFAPIALHIGAAQVISINSIGSKDESAPIPTFIGRKLVYLGQANGIAVLYDTVNTSPIYVPASSVIIETDS
jgi:hypothetical protein